VKTIAVNGVLTSYELMLAIYLGTRDGVLDCAATLSCGSDTVTYPVLGWIITPLPHGIVQLSPPPTFELQSFIFSISYHPFLLFYGPEGCYSLL